MKHSTFSSFSLPSHIEILVFPTDRDAYMYDIVHGTYSCFYQLKICFISCPNVARFGQLTKIILEGQGFLDGWGEKMRRM